MPFTPDSELELAFSASLIPQDALNGLSEDLHVSSISIDSYRFSISPSSHHLLPLSLSLSFQVRPLSSTDYRRGHISLLTVLTSAPDPGEEAWVNRFRTMKSSSSSASTYFPIVIIDKESDKIVACGTVFLELKFIRGLASAAHIEDIAVDKQVQGKGLGKRIIEVLTRVAEGTGAYKTILDCSNENQGE